MIRNKSFFVLLIVALLLGVVGSAFAQDDALVIWADDTRAPVLEDLGAAFEAEFGVAVVVQEYGFGDIRDNFKTAGPAGEGPDIIIGAHDWLGELVVNNLLQPMELGDLGEAFLPAATQAFVYDGLLYGMPYATENVAFVYNPELVAEAPTTWEEVAELSAELRDADAGTYGYIIQDSDPFHFFGIQTAFGGYVFGQGEAGYDVADVGIDSEGAIAAAEYLQGLVEADLLPSGVDYDVMHALFENSEAAMIITGPWAIPRIQDSGVAFEVAALPEGPAGVAQPFLGVQGFMISAFSDKQLLAESFLLDFVATSDAMQSIYDADPRPSAFLEVRDTIEDPIILGFVNAGTEGLAMPAIPEMGSVWSSWGDALTLIRTGELSGSEAFTNAAAQIRTAIEGSDDESGDDS